MIDSSEPSSDRRLGHILMAKAVLNRDRNPKVIAFVNMLKGTFLRGLLKLGPKDNSATTTEAIEEAEVIGPRAERDDMTECPVCSMQFLDTMKDSEVQLHVESCLTQPSSALLHGNRYISKCGNCLPTCPPHPWLSQRTSRGPPRKGMRNLLRGLSGRYEAHDQCSNHSHAPRRQIGQRIAVLNCLCQFHETCIDQWFFVKQECPVHHG